jgi:hypothetical protein
MMAHNVELAARVRDALSGKAGFTEKALFGGQCFLYNGNILCGVISPDLMIRLSPALAEKTLGIPGCSAVVINGNPIEGMVHVSKETVAKEADLTKWLNIALKYVSNLPAKKAD